MKKSIGAIAVTAALVAVFGAGRAQAQVLETLKFKTTFPFTAGHTTFPAGSYTVRPLGIGTDILEISNSNGSSTSLITVQAAGAKDPEKMGDEVIFKKQGDSYVLSQIWDSAERAGVETMPAKTEEPHQHHHQA
jgi:hypothetical protein